MRSNLNNDKGVTLIELLISMAIMGILGGMVATILVIGTSFFRKQSELNSVQSDSHMITASLTKAVLEGTDFKVIEESVYKNKSGDDITCFEFSTGDSKYLYALEGDEAGYLYVYPNTGTITLQKGNCLTKHLESITVKGKVMKETIDESGVTPVKVHEFVVASEAENIDVIEIELNFKYRNTTLKQNFEVRPRNSVTPFKIIVP